MTWGEIKAYVMRGLMMERKDYQLNAPSMGGKDSQRKWKNKIVEPQMKSLFNQMFPMTKEGRKEITEEKKRKAPTRKEKLRKVREATDE